MSWENYFALPGGN